MTSDRVLASPADMHGHLVDQLNLVLRRPGMFGKTGVSMWFLIDHLLYLERRREVWREQTARWEERGVWAGARDAFASLLPADQEEYCISSVYAEFARREGWLTLDRELSAEAYAALRESVGRWAGQDRVWSDVTAAFGPPSVLIGGPNPNYGKTLVYASPDPTQPMVSFHLWNGTDPSHSTWPTHEQPLLLAVRCGEGDFVDSFTFTPQGRRRQPQNEHAEQLA
ncbi:hypothetical protein ACIQZB_37345 [Streptomyces sp. NPDC097727]|uniref:hypothetical protein n=1 Tax=Streptomyces sp. NPDC097727 TaxID=3366092 RepID=UPI0037F3DAB9